MIKTALFAVTASMVMLTACGIYSKSASTATIPSYTSNASSSDTEVKAASEMELIVSGKSFSAVLENNDTVTVLAKMLPLTLNMSELNGNEKYYYLDTALPSAPERVGHINEGDIMLYGDKCIVVFYKSFDTTYSYTKIGHIADTTGLADALGKDGISVNFQTAGITKTAYTAEDVRNLQNFLLNRPTEEELTGKPYDLDSDGVWSVLDLCMMKKYI